MSLTYSSFALHTFTMDHGSFSYYTFLIPSDSHFSARVVEVRIFLGLSSNLVCLRHLFFRIHITSLFSYIILLE